MTNRRRDDSVTRKITSFRFNVELLNRFSEFAKVNGYNCTEGLEVLMIKAMEGLLPKKESVLKKVKTSEIDITGCTKLTINTKPYATIAEVIDKLEEMGQYELANHYRKESESGEDQ